MRIIFGLLIFSAMLFSQAGPPRIITGVDPPTTGTCNDEPLVGNIYVRSADSAIIPIGVFRCTQIKARIYGAAAYSWQPIDHLVMGTLPATCTVGDMAFKTGVAAGQNLYGCTSTNIWTQQAGGGGPGGLTTWGGSSTATWGGQ
jgi:hypothetical protein